MTEKKVTQAVEAICAMGCTTVNAIIDTIESGNRSKGLEDFSDEELSLLARELKSIMSVYENK